MWRATLADGRIVTYNGENSPQQFLDLIVEFAVFRADGSVGVVVRPDAAAGERLVYRRRPTVKIDGTYLHVAHVVGILHRDSGLAFITQLDENGAVNLGYVDPIEFTSVELA